MLGSEVALLPNRFRLLTAFLRGTDDRHSPLIPSDRS